MHVGADLMRMHCAQMAIASLAGFVWKSHWKLLGSRQPSTEQRCTRLRPRVQTIPEIAPGRRKGVQGISLP
ncbi:hypothetical protein PCAR4_40149 [Paraburkholderia caribensis]|nr:hypothetical protein PCAR4_40149 [Paraburkholderia caribensis]